MLNHFIVLAAFMLLTVNYGYSQTLFSRHDTTPDYKKYRYFDECLESVNRIIYNHDIKNPLWPDTAIYDLRTTNTSVPEKAVNIGRVCLAGINLESVPVRDYDLLVRLLLLVNRDEDANRLVHSALDTINSSFKGTLFLYIGEEYRRARPKRMFLTEKLLMRDDSQYSRNIDKGGDVLRAVELAKMALDLGQNDYATTVANEILNKDGKYAEKIPKMSVNDLRTVVFPFLIEVSEFLTDQAAGSLISNTMDYRKFQEEIWSRLSKEKMPKVAGNNIFEYLGAEMPIINGDFSYTNIHRDGSASDNFKLDKIQKLSPQPIPVKGKVNLIAFFHGGCHLESTQLTKGRNNWTGLLRSRCWTSVATIRRLKQRFPELHVTIVSKTFGSIGTAPPLEPKDEADTLADYFLNFHKIPGVHLISNTEFVRIPGYDQRRIDIRSQFEIDIDDWEKKIGLVSGLNIPRSGNFLLIDEHGLVFHVETGASNRAESILTKKIGAVIGRQVSAGNNHSKTDK